jgi:low molecular weight phosphotyrosine protein phosphatase
MAEAVFKAKVEELGYSQYFKLIDSFGTSNYHIGSPPDSRSAKTCRKHGVPVNHSGQQIQRQDFKNFDYILAMDEDNKADLLYMKPKDFEGTIELFGKWRTDKSFQEIVDDPYYGGINGFDVNFKQLSHFSEEFLKQEIGELDA